MAIQGIQGIQGNQGTQAASASSFSASAAQEPAPMTLLERVNALVAGGMPPGSGSITLTELQEWLKGNHDNILADPATWGKAFDDRLDQLFDSDGTRLVNCLQDRITYITYYQEVISRQDGFGDMYDFFYQHAMPLYGQELFAQLLTQQMSNPSVENGAGIQIDWDEDE